MNTEKIKILDLQKNLKIDLIQENHKIDLEFFDNENKDIDFSAEINIYWKNSQVKISGKSINTKNKKKIKIKTVLFWENQQAEILIKWICDFTWESDFQWIWIVSKNSNKWKIFIEEEVILFWKKSKAKALPILKIESDDVLEASHKASISPIDQEKFFYIQTRGLDEKSYKDLIINWFLK